MQAGERPALRSILTRTIRLACPACGEGPIFGRYFVRAERCARCGWAFEREAGHWVGGAEVNMFASYFVSVLIALPILLFAELTLWLMSGVVIGHVACSLAFFRYSRALFLSCDYLLDPTPPAGGDEGDDGAGWPSRPRPPTLAARATAAALPHRRGSSRRPRKDLRRLKRLKEEKV